MKAVKCPGLVVLLGGLDGLLPVRRHQLRIVGERVVAGAVLGHHIVEGLHATLRSGLHQVVLLLPPGILQQVRIGDGDGRRESQVLGVVRDHEEVQGPVQARRHPGAGDDLLAHCEAVGILRGEYAAHHPGVARIRGMEVRVAEEDLVGEFLTGVGRVLDLLVGGSGSVLGKGRKGQKGQTDESHNGAHWFHWFHWFHWSLFRTCTRSVRCRRVPGS